MRTNIPRTRFLDQMVNSFCSTVQKVEDLIKSGYVQDFSRGLRFFERFQYYHITLHLCEIIETFITFDNTIIKSGNSDKSY